MSFVLGAIVIVILAVLYSRAIFRGTKRQHLPLPPGPPGNPIIGNLWDLSTPGLQDWEHFFKHKDLYGPISYMNVVGQPLIMINDARLALKLLERRSRIHSYRPANTFGDLAGWSNALGALRNADDVGITRKYFHQEIGTTTTLSRFNEIQLAEVGRFLLRLLKKPTEFKAHIRKEAGAVILKIAYGYTVEPHTDDPLVDLADKAMQGFSIAFSSTSWAVNFIPILQKLPAWFPGAGFIKLAKEFKKDALLFSDVPHRFVTQQMKNGTFKPSFLSELLQKHPVEPGSKEETIIKWSAGSMYAGGSDTTVSSISCFFLAMALFPEVQRKAQEEIDSVVGNCRLPQFEDRQRLSYIDAIVKEVFRWHPVSPLNVPHVSTQDDVCEGVFIPKGSWVLVNIWALTHDPSIYDEPMSFKPERFLESLNGNPPVPDPRRFVFGFGRRACPGRALADANVFLTIAQSLAMFNISKPVENGKVQDIGAEFTSGLISHPMPYKLSISPRSSEHRELIESLETRYPWENSDAELLAGIR